MKIQEIEIKKIRITENHRTNVEGSAIDELMQNIKQHGVLSPIRISPDGNGKYILIFGNRRYLACQKLGFKTIPAMVTGPKSKKSFLIENLSENMQRKDPSFAELGRVIKQLEDDKDLNLSLKEIAVNLGYPLSKIQTIVKVYDALPEKFRKRVMFMEKGGGRTERKGCIPANVANKIVALKKEHSLDDANTEKLFNAVSDENLALGDLNNVAALISSGVTAEQALNNMREFGVFTVEVVIRHEELVALMEQNSVMGRANFFKKVMYGELPPLVKPSFVSTGLKAVKKAIVKLDRKPYNAMFKQLLKLSRAKGNNLTEEQIAAIKTINETAHYTWSAEMCGQIKSLFDIHFPGEKS